MVQRNPYRLAVDVPLLFPEVRNLRGAVQEIVEVWSCEARYLVCWSELSGDTPIAPFGDIHIQFNGALLETTGPHERGWHIQMAMGPVDPGVRAVRVIRVERIAHPYGAAMAGHIPLMDVGPRNGHVTTICTRGPKIVHVFGELMERIAPWGRPAHPQFEWRGIQSLVQYGDFGFVMGTVLERDRVPDRFLGLE